MKDANNKKLIINKSQKGKAPQVGPEPIPARKPVLFHYHDYILFLNDWIQFNKRIQKGFSLRKLASACRISIGYLPMVLSGKRPLSLESFQKLLPALQLSKAEQQFFACIHSLGTTSSQNERMECLHQMKRYSAYREHYPNESEVYHYLTKWYYYTIRELTADPEFKFDAEWVQGRLREHVSLADVKEALQFLLENKYIIRSSDGIVIPPEKHLSCEGGIYKVTLAEYHRQLLELAEKSITNANSSERHLIGHTFAISENKYEKLQQIMKDVVLKIQTLTDEPDTNPKDSVYHIEMALFPLTLSKEKNEKDK